MSKAQKLIRQFFEDPYFNFNWNILMLSHNILKSQKTHDSDIIKITEAQSSAGFVIRSTYIDYLLAYFKQALYEYKMTKIWEEQFCVDQLWKPLQKIDNWFGFTVAIGKQKRSYSDIEKKIVGF